MPAGDYTNEIIFAIKEIERSIVSASASVANAKSVVRHRALWLLAKLEAQKARLKKQLGKLQEQASIKMKLWLAVGPQRLAGQLCSLSTVMLMFGQSNSA